MHNREVIDQDLLNMVISSRIRILHPYHLHVMFPADLIFLPVAVFDNLILEMFLSVQFDRENRNFFLSCALIHDKVKAAGIKQVAVAGIILKDL